MTQQTITPVHEVVQDHYGRIASSFQIDLKAQDDGCCGDACDCGPDLYQADVSHLPVDVTGLSLGCGDPITLAELQVGQTVLDLGSGGGIDCFLAAKQVGETGHVIGVDMTPAMLEKAERNKVKLGLTNVDFRQGQIEDLPVADNSVDVIISNCVVNLSPDKTAVFQEAYRVLKTGGRLAISDMMTQGQFTPQQRADMSAWAGCITGAEDVATYVSAMQAAGFTNVTIQDKNDPSQELAHLPANDGAAKIFSARITAVK